MGVHATLRIGAQDAVSSLQRISPDQLFLSFDTSNFPAGCALAATVDNGRAGQSQPFTVARLIRLPRIVSVTAMAAPGDSTPPAGLHPFQITGDNLEMIGQLSWDRNLGVDVTSLPAAIPGQGQRQTLLVSLPDSPAADAPLFLWMRGETTARVTTATMISLPPTPPNPARTLAVSPLVR
jgi:hypothetical protein